MTGRIGRCAENREPNKPASSTEWFQRLRFDKGYDHQDTRNIAAESGFTVYISAQGEEAAAFQRESEVPRPMLGGGTHPQVDEPLLLLPCTLGERRVNYITFLAFCLRPHCFPHF